MKLLLNSAASFTRSSVDVSKSHEGLMGESRYLSRVNATLSGQLHPPTSSHIKWRQLSHNGRMAFARTLLLHWKLARGFVTRSFAASCEAKDWFSLAEFKGAVTSHFVYK